MKCVPNGTGFSCCMWPRELFEISNFWSFLRFSGNQMTVFGCNEGVVGRDEQSSPEMFETYI